MKIKILQLKPNSRFHFGKPLVDSDTSLTDTDTYLHSDVLFSALVNNLASVRNKEGVDEFINTFESGKIKISSAFYCIKHNNDFIYLVPRPVNIVNQVDLNKYDQIKIIKKIQFVEVGLLGKPLDEWFCGGNLALSKVTAEKLGLIQKKNTLFKVVENTQELRFSLFQKKLNTQVGLRSMKEEKIKKNGEELSYIMPKGPYTISYIQIADLSELDDLSIHFYFMYAIEEEKYVADFDLAVDLLKYNGIGGERSSGYGQVDAVINADEEELSKGNNSAKMFLSLSKIIPADTEELEKIEAYTHTLRGGRHTGNQKLKCVRMINEGALLTSEIKGHIEDISSDNNRSYLRYGKAFLLPLPDTFKID